MVSPHISITSVYGTVIGILGLKLSACGCNLNRGMGINADAVLVRLCLLLNFC
jgi:hypothetical protein